MCSMRGWNQLILRIIQTFYHHVHYFETYFCLIDNTCVVRRCVATADLLDSRKSVENRVDTYIRAGKSELFWAFTAAMNKHISEEASAVLSPNSFRSNQLGLRNDGEEEP